MAPNNLSLVLYGPEDLRLEQREIPQIRDDQVLLRMDSVGICGTDIHYYVSGRVADFHWDEPLVVGHESAGVVTKVGSAVNHLQIGDRVAIEPLTSCRHCEQCRHGRYHLCPATPLINGHGHLSRYYAHAADFCYKLPDHVTMEEGAMLEPLAVAVHACRRAGVGLGRKVLILGAGPIGLLCLITAKAMGTNEILITDVVQSKLDLAKNEFGASHTINVANQNENDLAKKIAAELGDQPEVTIDCTGYEATNRLAILSTKAAGRIVIVGCGPPDVKVPIVHALTREIDICGAYRYCNDFPAALDMVASGRVDIKKLVTHNFDLTEAHEAFETSRYGKDGAIKVMIHCSPRNENNHAIQFPIKVKN